MLIDQLFLPLQVVPNLVKNVYAAPNQIATILDMQEVLYLHYILCKKYSYFPTPQVQQRSTVCLMAYLLYAEGG